MKYSLLAFKYFIDVVETQGFTPAAKRNFVSQTAISNAIKNLEKELDIELIDRSTSHFKVTLAGINLYHYAVPLLNKYYEFGEKISQLDTTYHILKIHYLRSFSYWAIKLAQLLTKYNPDLQLQLDTENFATSIPKLDAGDYDILIGFSTAVSKIKNIHVKNIGTASFGVLVNRALLNDKNHLQRELAAKQPLFLQKWSATDDNDVQSRIRIILQDMNIDYNHTVYLDSFDAALSNVILGHGLAIYPRELPIPKAYDKALCFLPQLPQLKYDVVAIYKKAAINNILDAALIKKKHVKTNQEK